MLVALATCGALPAEFTDDELLADALRVRGAEASFAIWDDPAVAWDDFDRIVIRSTWDYTRRIEDFLAWARSLEGRLRNPPELIAWNADKRYVADLRAAGLPVVETAYVAPGDAAPRLAGDVVVKPSISAGGRDTGRFGPGTHDEARTLIERIQATGRTAMVQPYLAAVDSRGETAIVCIGGEPAHVLRKRAVLRPDEIAPLRDDALAAAEAMYDPELVRAGEATAAELALATAVLGELERRFDHRPLYARVDMLAGDEGEPVMLELEAIEPCLYLAEAPATAERLADVILTGG